MIDVGNYTKIIIVSTPNNADKVFSASNSSGAVEIVYEVTNGNARKIMLVSADSAGAYSVFIINSTPPVGSSWGTSWGTSWG